MAASYNELFGRGPHSEDANMEGWWLLQEAAASTTVDDQSSNSNDGTLVGGDNTGDIDTTGPNNWLPSALQLDGTDDYISIADIDFSGASASFTVMCRFNADTYVVAGAGVTRAIIEKAASSSSRSFQMFSHEGSDYIRHQMFDGTNNPRADSSGLANYPTGSWNHIAAVRDVSASDMLVYGNGSNDTAASSDVAFTTDFNENANLTIGGGALAGLNARFDGAIADVSVFSRALSAAEIAQANSGPELNYSSGVSFASNGAYDVGTWALPSPFASGSNGTATYEVIAVKADGTVLDSATTATGTLDLSANAGNTCYLLARVSNTGGYDIGDNATRTSGYGSANDGYYEIASVLAAGGVDLTDSLDFWYPLDEASASDNAIDAHTGGLDLTQSSSPGVVTGKVGGARDFTSPDYFSRASSAALQFPDNADWSVSVWVNADSMATYRTIMAKYEGASREFGLVLNATGQVVVLLGLSGAFTFTHATLTAGVYSHIVVMFDASADELTVVIDGSADTKSATTTWSVGTSHFYLGNLGGSNVFDGKIDEAAKWHRLLTTGEIAYLYNGGTGVGYPAAGPATGTAAQVLPALTQAAAGSPTAQAAASQALPSLTQAAAGTAPAQATAAQVLPALVQAAAGGSVPAVATVAQTLPALVQAATGTVLVQATASQVLPLLFQSALSTIVAQGTAAQVLAPVAQTALGTAPATAAAAQVLPSLAQVGAGAVLVQAAGAQVLPMLTQAGLGALPIVATAAQVLPPLAQAASSAGLSSGPAAQVLPPLVQTAAGAVLVQAAGAQAMPALVQAASSRVVAQGTAAQLLAPVTQTAAGGPVSQATAAQALPVLVQAAASQVAVQATVAQALPSVVQSAQTIVLVQAYISQTLPSLIQEATTIPSVILVWAGLGPVRCGGGSPLSTGTPSPQASGRISLQDVLI